MIQSRCFSVEDIGGGKMRTTIGLRPTHINKGAGWVAMSNALGATGDANLTIGVDELIQFRIRPKLSGNAPVVHFGSGKTHVRFTPLGTNNIDGVVRGNGITFPGAWANADLVYRFGGHILREDIVLRAGHPESFAFRIDEHAGLNTDTLATPDFTVAPPVLCRDLERVELAWAKSTSGGKLILTSDLPVGNWAGWTLDPTLTLQPDAAAGKDNYIDQVSAPTNYGTAIYIYFGWISSTRKTNGLFQFDVSSIAAGTTVLSSVLTLVRYDSGGSAAPTYGAYEIIRSWTEAGSSWTYSDNPTTWGTAGCDNTTTDRSGVAENDHALTLAGNNTWSIPTMTQDWVNTSANNKGIWISIGAAYSAASYWAAKSSDDATAGDRPKLVVEYAGVGQPAVARMGGVPFVHSIGRGVW